jgi:lipopolysaccharide transport system permease protein
MAKQEPPLTHIRPGQSVGVFDIVQIWRYRSLLSQMVARQLAVRITASPLNLLWGFIRPGIMTLAFFYLRHLTDADFGQTVPYALYIFSGFCLWFLFADIVVQIATSLAADAAVIQRVYYPRILGPLSILMSRVVDVGIILLATFILQLVMGVAPSPHFYWLPLATLTLLALAFGLGTIFAALILFHADSRKVLDIILYLGLFVSPVLFERSLLPAEIQKYYVYNPMVGILGAIRGSMFAPASIDFHAWQISGISAIVLVTIGLLFLSRAARVVGERV